MLAIGELAVRRISKLEDTAPASVRGTKLSFGRTSRIQVSCGSPVPVSRFA
jgi:hypothetical protein